MDDIDQRLGRPDEELDYWENQRDKRPLYSGIVLNLVLVVITLGIWDLVWNYRQMRACNAHLGRREFRFWVWILLILVTLGLYYFYYQYKMGKAIVEIQQRYEAPVFADLPIISLIVSIVGFGVVADVLHQNELNKLVP